MDEETKTSTVLKYFYSITMLVSESNWKWQCWPIRQASSGEKGMKEAVGESHCT